jgi:ABC-type multidrug transport system ATPase subunit
VIELRDVRARGIPQKGETTPELRGVTAQIGAGVTALVGPRPGGGPLLLDLVFGRVRPRTGAVTVLGHAPGASSVQKDVAYVPIAAQLPNGLTVQECVQIAFNARARGPRDAAATLERLGVTSLALRNTTTLTPGEHRAVLLAIALACTPRVLLMEEPCTWFDARALAKTTEALRALASEGAAVIVSTQSAVDAERLGGRTLRVENGVVGEGLPHRAHAGLSIACDRAKELGAALSSLASVRALSVEGARVVVSGPDARALARDVGCVIASGGFDIGAMEEALT